MEVGFLYPNSQITMKIRFSKMHGLGNDFMVIDAVTQRVFLNPKTICKLSDRHFGIGFDQLLVVEPPFDPDMDFHYRIFNADGGEVQQCGNGARCFARFVRLKGLTTKRTIAVSTMSGKIILDVDNNELVIVNMGAPIFNPPKIPFRAQKFEKTYILQANDQNLFCGVVSMGNPHCVIEVPNIKTAAIEELGPILESHERFPERVNVGFMQIISRNEINLRVYERGAGETMACGTGACAATVVGITQGKLDKNVLVHLPGGDLKITWEGGESPVMMKGPAEHVYDGEIDI